MTQFMYNIYLLYSIKLFSIIGLQTDNTLFITDNEFTEQEATQLQKAGFLAKEYK